MIPEIPESWRTTQQPASVEMIRDVEERLGVEYPEDFRSMAPSIHGAETAAHSAFVLQHPTLGEIRSGIDRILSFDPDSTFFVLSTTNAFRSDSILPVEVVPFAEDAGGDLVAFDFRHKPARVVYVATAAAEEESDRHIYPLAPSFTAFLEMLED